MISKEKRQKRNNDMQSLGEHYGTKFNIFLHKQTGKIQTWFTKFSPTKRIIILFSIFAALLIFNLLFII